MMVRRWMTGVGGAAVLALLLALAGLGGMIAMAQEPPAPGEVGVYFIKYACPNADADVYTDCDIVTGATFRVEANGVEIEGSPFTTEQTVLLPGFSFRAPEDATLTITEVGGSPDGYMPAPGFDPLTVNVANLPAVGCGGEAMCPGVQFINVPVPAETTPTVPPVPGTGDSSLTIYKAACPPGFTGMAYFEECFDTPLSGAEFFVGNVEAEGANPGLEGTTGPSGFVGFDVQATGRTSVVEAVPEGYVDYAVVCTDAAGQAVSIEHLGSLAPPPGATTARFGIELDIATGGTSAAIGTTSPPPFRRQPQPRFSTRRRQR